MGEESQKSSIPSTKPYLIRALYEWCVDCGFTPYLSVFVDETVQVPYEYVKKDEIVLNIGPTACQDLLIDNESITFKARFSGVSRELFIPTTHVMAIYSRENNQGMSFPVQIPEKKKEPSQKDEKASKENTETINKSKSHLKLVK